MATFTTDFHVTFGMFVCFDIWMENPAMELVRRGVKNFIMPTHWHSDYPFMSGLVLFFFFFFNFSIFQFSFISQMSNRIYFHTGLQTAQAWAYANNVNLLMANGNDPMGGYTGSGIFSGQVGAVDMTISSKPTNTILASVLPNIPGYPRPNSFNRKIDTLVDRIPSPFITISADIYTDESYKELDFEDSHRQEGEFCQNDFCCHYEIEVYSLPRLNVRIFHFGFCFVSLIDNNNMTNMLMNIHNFCFYSNLFSHFSNTVFIFMMDSFLIYLHQI